MSASFPQMLADYAAASRHDALAADRLPMGEHGERMRYSIPLSPQTVALNWRANVSDAAAELRQTVNAVQGGRWIDALVTPREAADMLATAARALLAAIGEEQA